MLPIEKYRPRILILVLSGISLLARLLFLGGKSLWIDECLAWGAVRMSWMDLPSIVATGTPHPPLAFIIMKLSSLFAGDSEFGLRLLVAVAVASAVIPVFRLASRRTTVRGGFWTGMVWAVCPFAVSLGQEAWVYGINAAISLWFVDIADLAWRGSRKGFVGSLVLGAAGIFTQHIFVLSIAVSGVLYFTIDPRERISLKRFIIVPAALALLYAPVFLFFSAQFAERTVRMATSGFENGFSRLFSSQPFSQFFRILGGGLLPEISRNLLDRPRMLLVYMVNAAVILFLAIWPFFTRMMKPVERKYLWLALLIPFGLYLNDEPTIRQLSVLWIPFSLTSAIVFTKYRWLGFAVSSLCLLALVPYYGMKAFPYHRSDWRTAVTTVESLSQPGDLVVVFGGKSTSLAWEYYSNSDIECLTPAGDDPFAGDRGRKYVNPEFLLDSILTSGSNRDVWVILDCWDIPSIHSIKGRHEMDFFLPVSERMEVALLKSDP